MIKPAEARVLTADSIDSLRTVMSAPIESFFNIGNVRAAQSRRLGEAYHIYIDRGSSVLGVAHLDSVQKFGGLWFNGHYISCATIDNRLGVWLMLYGLPSIGINFDVLLTENEEMGASTAGDFKPSKEYNWAFSFDRGGDDVACYQYYNRELEDLLASYSLKSTWGSYSDVADLELGVKCMNFGNGMHNYHSDTAYCRISELGKVVDGFVGFYADNKDERLVHEGKGRYSWEDEGFWADYTYGGAKAIDRNGELGMYVNGEYESATDQQWEEYRRTGQATSYPLVRTIKRRWDIIDAYYANQATSDPTVWFDGFCDPDEWSLNHSMGDINTMAEDDPAADLYFGNSDILVMCENCENLFTRGDADRYDSIEATLCKTCFYYLATEEGFPEQ